MKNTIYTIALTASTLTAFPSYTSEGASVMGGQWESVIATSYTSKDLGNDRRYLNYRIIQQSFRNRLVERSISQLPSSIEKIFNKISDKCSSFDIKEVYADYSPVSNAIRIDMIIDNDFLLIVRKTFGEDEDNCVAISLSKDNESYLADYLNIENLAKEVGNYFKG